jgi:hypothetical protein
LHLVDLIYFYIAHETIPEILIPLTVLGDHFE